MCLGAESPAATICLQMTLKVRIYFNSFAAEAVACPRHSGGGPTCVKTNEAFNCESGSTIWLASFNRANGFAPKFSLLEVISSTCADRKIIKAIDTQITFGC